MQNNASKEGRSFLDVLGLLNRRKFLIIAAALVGTGGVFLFALISILLPPGKTYLPNYYFPQANIIINEDSSADISNPFVAAQRSSLGRLSGLGVAGPSVASLAQKIASTNLFLDQIATDFDLIGRNNLEHSRYPKTAARRFLKKGLRFSMDNESRILTVGFEYTDKELATAIVNKVVELLETQFTLIAMDKNRIKLRLVAKKLSEVKAEILRLQDALNALHREYSTYDITTLAKEQASRLASLRSELVEKTLEIESYNSRIGVEDPALRRLRVEQDSLRLSIAKLEGGYRESGIVVPAESELRELVMRQTRLQGDLEVQETLYKNLIQEQELVKLQVESIPPTFQIYERAEVPERKAGPSRAMICLVGAGASFFLSIVLAFLVDYFLAALRNPANLRKLKGKDHEAQA